MALLRLGRTLQSSALKLGDLQSCRWHQAVSRPPLQTAQVESREVTFTDAQTAFKSKPTWELFRAALVFRLCGVDLFVSHNDKIMSLSRTLLGGRLFKWLMKRTFYGQFAAGECREEVEPLVLRNQKFGVQSILQYSVESAISADKLPPEIRGNLHHHVLPEDVKESTFDGNTARFITSLDFVADTTEAGKGICAIKLTALGCADMLEDLTCVLKAVFRLLEPLRMSSARTFSTVTPDAIGQVLNQSGLVFQDDSLRSAWFHSVESSGLHDVSIWDVKGALALSDIINAVCKDNEGRQPIPVLSEEASKRFQRLQSRMQQVFERAAALGVRVLVDAEQSYLQLAIRRLALDKMRQFNKGRQIANSTYQCYLKETFDVMSRDMDEAKLEGFCIGAKLVRGAYMDEERRRAAALGYEDPVNPGLDATSAMYHRVADEVMRRSRLEPPGAISVMMATHNENAIHYIIARMKHHGVQPSEGTILFGQLLGMGDHISFTLGDRGYTVYKCLHYGPVDELLAYLGRRAQENGGFLGKGVKERQLVTAEIKRRFAASLRQTKPGAPPVSVQQ